MSLQRIFDPSTRLRAPTAVIDQTTATLENAGANAQGGPAPSPDPFTVELTGIPDHVHDLISSLATPSAQLQPTQTPAAGDSLKTPDKLPMELPKEQVQAAMQSQGIKDPVSQIIDWEARRDKDGNIAEYKLPKNDGGGTYEFAGINDKFHPEAAAALRKMAAGDREPYVHQVIKSYTDKADEWSSNPSINAVLRDTIWNRGAGGAAKTLQIALGVAKDGVVGPKTLAALRTAEGDPAKFLTNYRQARETYEKGLPSGIRPNFAKGLRNRWDKSTQYALSLLDTNTSSG